ncbi:amidohydrolase [Gulosibacter macacae]|uniref:Amidohydrolase n=1 Tax=Gulosibacter macacae TaxID=2488791 RepID=A0A3P3VZT9_9MICO|nr:amidohydrolase [Gulosibacter macacae]RRJ88295.1 amidohydrolase [Gulosibacter macacae]
MSDSTLTHHDLSTLARQWHEALVAEGEFARAFRRELHATPRVSGDEADTRDRFAQATGLTVRHVADTGGIGRLGPASGPAIAIRGELDALPVVEATGVEFASTTGNMHACGHDVHLAALAALVRAASTLELPYALIPVLQPREEAYPSGALDIQRSGVLADEGVVHAIGAHVHPRVPRGSVATGAGAVNAAAGELEVIVTGKGGHGAYPHHASDVVAALSSIALGLPEVVRRTVDPLAPALLSVGRLIADSGAANVLPAEGRLLATVRTTGIGDAQRIADAVARFAEGQAASYGVTATTRHTEGEPVLANDAALSQAIDRLLPGFGLVPAEPMRSLGADDFSFFSEEFPSVMCFVGVGDADDLMAGPSLHDSTFLPDEDAVLRVANTMLAGYLAAVESIRAREQ